MAASSGKTDVAPPDFEAEVQLWCDLFDAMKAVADVLRPAPDVPDCAVGGVSKLAGPAWASIVGEPDVAP
jgi:hypothetical protein